VKIDFSIFFFYKILTILILVPPPGDQANARVPRAPPPVMYFYAWAILNKMAPSIPCIVLENNPNTTQAWWPIDE